MARRETPNAKHEEEMPLEYLVGIIKILEVDSAQQIQSRAET